MAKKPLYYIKQYPCCNEIAIINSKNDDFVSKSERVKKELKDYELFLSHDTKLIYKDLDYLQVEEIKHKLDKFFYSERKK